MNIFGKDRTRLVTSFGDNSRRYEDPEIGEPTPGLDIVPTETPAERRRKEREEAIIRQSILDQWDEEDTIPNIPEGPVVWH